MKITPSVVANASNVINPEGKLALVLRDLGILYIENLEPCSDVYSTIDLTNNDITDLSNIPSDGIIETILLANNNISSIGDLQSKIDLDESPSSASSKQDKAIESSTVKRSSLLSLLLINNNISAFSELAKLRQFGNLETLFLIGNPISEQHHYRPFLVWLLPKLRVLDGEKVKAADKSAASELFGSSWAERTPAIDALLHQKTIAATVSKETRLMTTAVKKLSAEEKKQLVEDLKLALSMDEIHRLSRAMKNGYVE